MSDRLRQATDELRTACAKLKQAVEEFRFAQRRLKAVLQHDEQPQHQVLQFRPREDR